MIVYWVLLTRYNTFYWCIHYNTIHNKFGGHSVWSLGFKIFPVYLFNSYSGPQGFLRQNGTVKTISN